MSRLKRPTIGVVWKLGEGVPAQVSSSPLVHGSKLRGWYKSDIIRFRIRIDYNLLFRINELHLLNADSKYRIWWISESPSSRAQIGRTTILLIDLRVSSDPVCRMATLLVPSVPGMSFSILAMGQERGCLLSSDIRTRLPTCTSDWEAFHLGLDW
ncbi:hypothetical protein TNCV_4496591 [Trichonephila clavipes]|nr:hypothetical protein TNCV_4496591 [Trichonephila clavipes]